MRTMTFWFVAAAAIVGDTLGFVAGQIRAEAVPVARADADCNRPAYLLVWIDELDLSKTGAYGRALRETGIVARYGGEYLAVGPPDRMLEGEWPENRGFVLERYPCLDAIERFWYSDEYQRDLVPLRADSGRYTVAAFEAYVPPGERP